MKIKQTSTRSIDYAIILLISTFFVVFYIIKLNSNIIKVERGLRNGIYIAGEKNEQFSLDSRMKYYKAPAVSIAVINGGKLEWARGYGNIASDVKSRQITVDTLFQAASISKPLTALGALMLVEQGKLSLDENVNTYLKSWKVPDNEFTKAEKVTLRRLLSHSAGTSVSGFEGYQVGTYIPRTVEILEGKKPQVNSDPVRVVHIPGKKQQYSGGGTIIVQLLIEDITGEKFDIWMKHNVLIPFGMHASSFEQPLSVHYSALTATGHDTDGKQICGKWRIHPEMAAAGLWTTPSDLAHFVLVLFNILSARQAGPISKMLLEEALTAHNEGGSSGLGFFIKGAGDSINFGHSGCNEGYIANLVAYPKQQKGWIIMVNNDGALGLIDEIERSISDVYGISGFEPIIKKTVPLDQAAYSKITGIYKDKAHTITINMHDNMLYILDSYIPQKMRLYPTNENRFFMKEQKHLIQFMSVDSQVDALVLLDENGKKITDQEGNGIVLKKD